MKTIWNDGWEFNLNDSPDSLTNDKWESVTLPHDWQIYDTSDLYRDGFGRYRKVFTLEDDVKEAGQALTDAADRHVFIVFDGVYMDSEYYLNGVKVGEWKYGYSQYVLELPSDVLKAGENELVVTVNFKSPNSRWYSGAGIYRNVWLAVYPQNYIPENGVYVHTQEVADGYLLYVDTEVIGDQDVPVTHRLYDRDGNEIELVPAGHIENVYVSGKEKTSSDRSSVREEVYMISYPYRWSAKAPYLYTIETHLPGQCVTNRVGFRNIFFDINKGMFLNGEHIKLNGVCEHHDLGVFGAEFNLAAMRRKIEILKTMGVNAIRGTHNMMAPGMLDLCDEMGVMFISESFDMWNHPKTPYDYARFFDEWHERDVRSWVMRDRNHPCVIMWSIGNEIGDIHNYEVEGQAMTRHLMELVETYDYRANGYITQGSNYMPWENAKKCADILKVAGYNYGESCYEEDHARFPDWIIYGSETSSITQSRGVYHLPLAANSLGEEDEQCSALGNSTTSWSAKSYEACVCIDRDTPFSLGQFLWSGFDYIGEPTPYQTRSAYFGQIDTAGFPKDSYYVWKSAWVSPEAAPFVHIFPYWDFNPGQIVDVRVVSNLPEVELFVNGRSLGRQTLDHEPGSGHHLIADWSVPYEEGEISAVAYVSAGSGEAGARTCNHSFGNTDHLVCTKYEYSSTDEPQNLFFFEISAEDEDSNPVENACDRVSVKVSGGELIGLDNGDSADPDGYRTECRRLFNGKLLAVVKADPDFVEAPELDLTWIKDNSDVRRISLICNEDRELTPDHRSVSVRAHIEPPEASGRELTYSIVDDLGVKSSLADISVTKDESGDDILTVNAKGDGRFRLRATAGGEGQKVRIISDLDFAVSGCGQAYRDPYEFVAGSTYSYSIGEAGSGNEKGFATGRGERTVVVFDDIDFGSYGAESITIPIFALDSDDIPLKVRAGVPGSGSEILLVDTVYSKPRQWAVFIEDTWPLLHRVKGITSVSFEFVNKVHVKGFVFSKADKAHARLFAAEADAIYGDEFTRTETAVEHIGNNVSLEFKDMDFGKEGIDSIVIRGRTPNETNPVHVRFFGDKETIKEVCEFVRSEEYTEQKFKLPHITGAWNVSLVFMPGSDFDLESFKFELS